MFSGQDNTVSYSNSVYYIDSTVLNSNSDYSNHCNSGSFSATETSDISISSHQCQETLAYQELAQDETDDLLYQFGNYFREKLNKEVKNFCGSMSSMFDEQQIHVKQIVNAARNYEMKQLSVPGVSSSSDGSVFKQNDASAIDQSYPESYQNEQKTCEESKERYIIRLLMLSSMISSTFY